MIIIFIHYGSDKYDPAKFCPIKRHEFLSKPVGGLWGSPVDAEYGWKDWCEHNGLIHLLRDSSFKFRLSDTAKILYIRSVDDLVELPVINDEDMLFAPHIWIRLDFEQLLSDGIDAIQINMGGELYFKLYGWDCDSILVMNKDVIIPYD